ncbi:uncharacterized protein F4807DRAFT_462450 [Annulohypoxylon truncatum]|uniref:uncharacterized protein n=1 Tax=Annulohypoxylon truncatum TaxID=327061 RepID=UPI0020077DC8|nr:uncharacterized protein F4807DRAFT_462450 [Annulohypoxylon truncatum]KAI1207644.1 hypothetical protein F4807DRAFT_462450 [Annulohypoxylon truncatum]
MLFQITTFAVWAFTATAGAAFIITKPTPDWEVVDIHPTSNKTPRQTNEAVLKRRINQAPESLTIAIINNQGGPISTSHASNVGGPSPIWGDNGPGTISSGGAAALVVPTGWAGNIAIYEAPVNGSKPAPATDSSLIEASFVVPDGYDTAVADIDVSYVNGFSNAITCACSNIVVTGCSLDLWDMNVCPTNDDNGGACANPLRPNLNATIATTFFAPCQGAAYTFPHDDGANSWGECQSGEITCCVGTACFSNPKQSSSIQRR